MQAEAAAPIVANMSAPPRSTVMLPRLRHTPAAAIVETQACVQTSGAKEMAGNVQGEPTACASGDKQARLLPVGPRGGAVQSHALCIARVDLPTALCARLRLSYKDKTLVAPLGLARALLALARTAVDGRTRPNCGPAARAQLLQLTQLSEGELVDQLARHLQSVAWPDWAPRVGFATYLAQDAAAGINRAKPPRAPDAVRCPLLAARVISGIRGVVFLREAAPTLSRLLTLWDGDTPSGTWELWLPIRPGHVRPMDRPDLPNE
jgi:hypothetical protein